MFNWIRKRVAAAVLGGFQDAIDALETVSAPQQPAELPEGLRLRLEAKEEEPETKPVRKRA